MENTFDSRTVKASDYEIVPLKDEIIVEGVELLTEEQIIMHQIDDKKVSAGVVKYVGEECTTVKKKDVVVFSPFSTMKTVYGLLTLPEKQVSCILKPKKEKQKDE